MSERGRGADVKKLDWDHTHEDCGYLRASTSIGYYRIKCRSEEGVTLVPAIGQDNKVYSTPDAAKEAAQIDYETRILAAII